MRWWPQASILARAHRILPYRATAASAGPICRRSCPGLPTPVQARRHEVRPGLTGWAQVNGRHQLEWDDRFALDVWYVDHWSLGLDLRILAATVKIVLSGKGAGMGKDPPANFRDRLSIGERDPR